MVNINCILKISYSDTVHLIASQNTSCDLITRTRGNTANIFTVKPLNTGHLRVLKYLSVIGRCPLLGGNFKKIVTFGSKCFDGYSWHARYWEFSLYKETDSRVIQPLAPNFFTSVSSRVSCFLLIFQTRTGSFTVY